MEYTLQDYCNRIREDVKDYDYILIGLGDEALNNNDSNLIDMLNKFGELLDKNNYIIENIDATIIAQKPKMRPYIDTMRENIAKALKIDVNCVNVKATTEEGLGFTGTGEGISSQAICSLVSVSNYIYGDSDMTNCCSGCNGCAARRTQE